MTRIDKLYPTCFLGLFTHWKPLFFVTFTYGFANVFIFLLFMILSIKSLYFLLFKVWILWNNPHFLRNHCDHSSHSYQDLNGHNMLDWLETIVMNIGGCFKTVIHYQLLTILIILSHLKNRNYLESIFIRQDWVDLLALIRFYWSLNHFQLMRLLILFFVNKQSIKINAIKCTRYQNEIISLPKSVR